jgi:hypothetical protein
LRDGKSQDRYQNVRRIKDESILGAADIQNIRRLIRQVMASQTAYWELIADM